MKIKKGIEKKGVEDLEKKIEKELRYSSEIINTDNINIFESLTCKTNKMKLIYIMTRDGGNRKSMQSKIKGHSNLIVLVKTNENKIFGGYTSCKIEYGWKDDSKAFLFSVDLNEKFNVVKPILLGFIKHNFNLVCLRVIVFY